MTLFTDALVLRLVPYRDADAVVHLLTREAGSLALLARGARSSRKRFGGALDYLCVVRAEVRPSRHGMGTIAGAELVRAFEAVRGDLDRYEVGCRLLETARSGAREGDPAHGLYELVLSALDALDRGAECRSLLRVFQARVLRALGYGLPLDACAGCGADLRAAGAAHRGGEALCRLCAGPRAAPLSPGALETLRASARLPADRLGTLRLAAAVEAEVAPLLEASLRAALGQGPPAPAASKG